MRTIQATLSSLPATILSAPVCAQDTADEIEDVVVVGTWQVIQSAIVIKRTESTIADGLAAADIRDLPALSIGEALETVTGVASHRENSGATEIYMRRSGPYSDLRRRGQGRPGINLDRNALTDPSFLTKRL